MGLNQLPLETRSLLIRRAVLDDAGVLFVLSTEPAYRTWLSNQVYRDESHARSSLEFLISRYSTSGDPKQGPCVLMIEHKTDHALIGHVGLSPLDDDVEIGFSIAKRYQGQGLAAEAIVAASRWAFDSFGLERILGVTLSENVASQRSLVRAGFAHYEDRVMMFQGTEQPVRIYMLSARRGPEVGA